ncbi:uncharacterized protein LOC128393271 [Panonychus citri]|uniref:uncharacterized protein LOC128393271 n=1 Tax=Panonychus citri TaxID=50023 RepID=UPI0023081358|nr:uncharacterized protein LOC128393271 [Panonychus citri]
MNLLLPFTFIVLLIVALSDAGHKHKHFSKHFHKRPAHVIHFPVVVKPKPAFFHGHKFKHGGFGHGGGYGGGHGGGWKKGWKHHG